MVRIRFENVRSISYLIYIISITYDEYELDLFTKKSEYFSHYVICKYSIYFSVLKIRPAVRPPQLNKLWPRQYVYLCP